jgi:hypothetical protein
VGCSSGDVQGGSRLDFLCAKNEDGYGRNEIGEEESVCLYDVEPISV